MTLPNRRGLLIVSLPANDPALAQAARNAGADMIKVHINVRHLASGTAFGTLAAERERLMEVLAVGLPTGLVPGETEMVAPEEMPELKRMQFAFLDAFVDSIRPYLYDAGIPVVPALPHSADRQFLTRARDLPGDWIEAAAVDSQGYGKPPQDSDFSTLQTVGSTTKKQLIVPTQRRIAPEDVSRYFDIQQVAAIMIGAIVTGKAPGSLGRATAEFRRELDRLFP